MCTCARVTDGAGEPTGAEDPWSCTRTNQEAGDGRFCVFVATDAEDERDASTCSCDIEARVMHQLSPCCTSHRVPADVTDQHSHPHLFT